MAKETQSGFYYGYIIVLASFTIMIVAGGSISNFAVFMKPLVSEFGWARGATAAAYGLFLWAWGIFGIGGGRLGDRFGPRLVLTTSALFLGSGYFFMSQINDIWQLYLCYALLLATGMGD
jgi:MFS family permease